MKLWHFGREFVEKTRLLVGEFGLGFGGALGLGGRGFCRARYGLGFDTIALEGLPIGIAAGIFFGGTRAVQRDDGADNAVEKVAIMAHKKNSSIIISEHFLQEIERFHVEIVRRLIKHEKIGGFC